MKKLYFSILILATVNASAQNFFAFNKNRPAYYSFNSYDVFYSQAGIYIDSFKVFGTDTVFYHYPIIDYDNSIYGCYLKAHDTSFVGDHSIRTAMGDDEFFNRYGDTVFFKNNSVVDESWTMLNLGGGNRIIATVQSIAVETILGVDDSVKKIMLQAKDSLGNSISNIFNNKIFKISKSAGLVSGYSLFHFPFDTIAFSIVGIENTSLGLSSENLSPEKIFDFEVGDRFDLSHADGFEPTTHNSFLETDSILSKIISVDGDTLTYQVQFINWSHGNSWYNIYDTITSGTKKWKFILSSYTFLLNKPFQYIGSVYENDYHFLVEAFYNSFLPVVQNQPDYFIPGGNDCLNWLVADDYYNDFYGAGLGKVMSYYGNWGIGGWMYESLIYYNKNGIEWGDSINWNELTGINTIVNKNSLQLFPNPTHDQLILSGNFSSSQTHFTLLNSFGEEMKLNQLSNHSGSVTFDVHDLAAGFYVLQVKKEDEVVNLKFVKE